MPKTERELTTRQKLLAKSGRHYRDVLIPEIGNVRLRNLTAREQIKISDSIQDKTPNFDVMVTYLMVCCVNEDGTPLFEEGDRPQVEELDSAVIARLSVEIRDLCGLDIGVKDSAKNSSSSRSDSSRSGSRKPAGD